jgi:hypothetical protein
MLEIYVLTEKNPVEAISHPVEAASEIGESMSPYQNL